MLHKNTFNNIESTNAHTNTDCTLNTPANLTAEPIDSASHAAQLSPALKQLIDQVAQDSRNGMVQSKETIVSLLALDPDSKACDYLRKAAKEAAMQITKGEAYLWGAIGRCH